MSGWALQDAVETRVDALPSELLQWWERPPSGVAALELEQATGAPAQLTDDDLVAAIVGFDRQISWAQARQARLLAELRRRRDAEYVRRGGPCFVPDEVGLALRLSPGESAARVERSGYLDEVLPDVLDAWESGALDAGKVRIITDATEVLAPEHAAAVAARVLGRAPDQSKGQLRKAVQRAVISVDPEGTEKRHQAARKGRRVEVHSQREGMGSLWAYLTAPDARACFESLTRLARGLGTDDPRLMDVRRSDLLVALLTGKVHYADPADAADPAEPAGPDGSPEGSRHATETLPASAMPAGQAPAPGGPAPPRPARERLNPVSYGKPLITVVIPHSTLRGTEDEPGELPGYGPIPAGLAREVAADGVWQRLVTDPLSGTVLDHGRTRYHPPAGLADHVRARDLHCRGPRCPRPATSCELDHHEPYPGGPTSAANLVSLCKRHHDLKGAADHGRNGWRVVLEPDGGLTWTTPTGLTWTSHPHDYQPDDHHPEDDDPGPADARHGRDGPPDDVSDRGPSGGAVPGPARAGASVGTTGEAYGRRSVELDDLPPF